MAKKREEAVGREITPAEDAAQQQASAQIMPPDAMMPPQGMPPQGMPAAPMQGGGAMPQSQMAQMVQDAEYQKAYGGTNQSVQQQYPLDSQGVPTISDPNRVYNQGNPAHTGFTPNAPGDYKLPVEIDPNKAVGILIRNNEGIMSVQKPDYKLRANEYLVDTLLQGPPTSMSQMAAMDNTDGMYPSGAAPYTNRSLISHAQGGGNEVDDVMANLVPGVSAGASNYLGQSPGASPSNRTRMPNELDSILSKIAGGLDPEKAVSLSINAQEGGYNGAVDYLMKHKPELAQAVQTAKYDLDKGIMANGAFKDAGGDPIKQTKTLTEGYEIIGKFASMIGQAKDPEEAAAMYKQALPMLKAVVPDAPDQLDDKAHAILTLAAAQAMPASQLFKLNQEKQSAESTVGKIQNDLEKRYAQGETSENSEGVRNLQSQARFLASKADEHDKKMEGMELDKLHKQAKVAQDELVATKTREEIVQKVNSAYQKDSKDFIKVQEMKMPILAALSEIRNNPNNGAAYTRLQYAYARWLNGGGTMTQLDVDASANTTGLAAQAWKKLKNIGMGHKESLNADEVKGIEDIFSSFSAKMQTRQSETNKFYQNRLDKLGLNRDTINFLNMAPPQAMDYLLQNNTKENQEYFKRHWGFVPEFPSAGQ